MTRGEEFIGRIMRFMSLAILNDWSCEHLMTDIERVIETYHMINGAKK